MFTNSHIKINGGTFTSHHHVVQSPRLDRLLEKVSFSAFHNSKERFDPPRCHPHTRKAILDRILQWARRQSDTEALILWIHGSAGAGKSAILQTIAEICGESGILLGSFFFSNRDPSRSNSDTFAATLASQICAAIPPLREYIEEALDRDILIFDRTVEVQLTELIINPIRHHLEGGGQIIPFMLVIDGLDECNDVVRSRLIQSIDRLVASVSRFSTPVMALVASRPHQDIRDVFDLYVTRNVSQISLDVEYNAWEDIRCFFVDKFEEIRVTHPLRRRLSHHWPSERHIDNLVERASGQFIYASTVVSFISSPRHPPQQRLEIIMGSQPPKAEMPFAQLDALYRQIFISIPDELRANALRLAHAVFVSGPFSEIGHYSFLLDLEEDEIELILLELSSIIRIEVSRYIRIYHASLRDYFSDSSRSGEQSADFGGICAEFAQLFMGLIREPENDNPRFKRAPNIKPLFYYITQARLSTPLVDDLHSLSFVYESKRAASVRLAHEDAFFEFGLRLYFWEEREDLSDCRREIRLKLDDALCLILDTAGAEATAALSLIACQLSLRRIHPHLYIFFSPQDSLSHTFRWHFRWHFRWLFPDFDMDILDSLVYYCMPQLTARTYFKSYFLDPSRSLHHTFSTDHLVYGASSSLRFLRSTHRPPPGLKHWARRSKTRPWLWRQRKPHSSFSIHISISARYYIWCLDKTLLSNSTRKIKLASQIENISRALRNVPVLLESCPVSVSVIEMTDKPNTNHLTWAMFPIMSRKAKVAIREYRKRASAHFETAH